MKTGLRYRGLQRPRVGLALGGGGLRGAAHVGVLEVLRDEEIKVDALAGSSAGALVAALYGAGFRGPQFRRLVRDLRQSDVVDSTVNLQTALLMLFKIVADYLHVPLARLLQGPQGLVRGELIERMVGRLCGGRGFAQLSPPVLVVAADLHTGQEVIFGDRPSLARLSNSEDRALLPDVPLEAAVRASISIPGIFVPRQIQNRKLVDGGVATNVPANVLHDLGMDIVLAVDLGYSAQADRNIDNVVEILLQSVDIIGQRGTEAILAQYAHCVIRPQIDGIPLTELHRLEGCIEKGRHAARQALPEIRRLLNG
ncbi:MAG TPA: patatin-like phospholipase family protein [Firmicutes bacterium]|jgi:NTE family protein|nr:patatin-like phospholipase family protein [Bacillota bacterium]